MSFLTKTFIFLGLSVCAFTPALAATGDISASGSLKSSVSTGTPPLSVNSSTMVPNLNADMLDDMHASDFALRTDGHISIPFAAMKVIHPSSDPWDGNSYFLGPLLFASGTTEVTASFVVPGDVDAPTNANVDIKIYNPTANGACQAAITTNFFWFYPVGGVRVAYVFNDANPFPVFLSGNNTISHRATTTMPSSGSTVTLGFVRNGDEAADNCGDVRIVGMEITYQKL